MAKLFQTYWYPLYAYTRRRGYGEEDAEDLVQAFCVHLQEKQALAKADPQRGKFRTFLLSSLPEPQAIAAHQQKEIQALTASLKEQTSQIQKVRAQIEVSKFAPRTVLNN